MRSRVTCKLAIIGSRPVEWSGWENIKLKVKESF
jgi:hypothetical protein